MLPRATELRDAVNCMPVNRMHVGIPNVREWLALSFAFSRNQRAAWLERVAEPLVICHTPTYSAFGEAAAMCACDEAATV
jgi:hypothetical protein